MYEAPEVTDLGSVEELTAAPHKNKIGTTPDAFSNISGIVGSVVTIP